MARDHVHDLVLRGGRLPVEIADLGRCPYVETLALQHAYVRERAAGARPDTILLVEHESVITVGRRGRGPDGFEPSGEVPVVEVERGGEATYHGPGQAVVYPIVYLPEGRRDLHAFLRGLEEAVIATLADHGVAGERVAGKTGVFVGGKKVASIGVAVSRWVTYHGAALNVRTDLSGFSGFAPCGLPSSVMGNIGPLLPEGVTAHDVGLALARHAARLLVPAG